ncbi:MAG TPA: ATP-dependent sacrificial sulfur transferase LarE [Thermoplasmata archaeon]|nr:ATP-dependent sacrificial sulfur transferase LarE [Thermoplasmata archaeon]
MSTPEAAARTVVDRIARGGPTLVALSGGVDSGLVAALAFEALGAGAVAATIESSAVSAAERDRARAVARRIGIRHVAIVADPIDRPEYRANPPDRCYHCRAVETGALVAWGRAEGIRQYLDGVHRDDLADDRPGLRAMNEAGFLHPLLWADWGKTEVRAVARARGLPNWDQPSDACLASRVAPGEPISPELLRRIETAESVVAAHGFRRVRVRVRGGAARVEVDPDDVARLTADPTAAAIVAGVRAAGFESVTLDPRGYGQRPPALRVVP